MLRNLTVKLLVQKQHHEEHKQHQMLVIYYMPVLLLGCGGLKLPVCVQLLRWLANGVYRHIIFQETVVHETPIHTFMIISGKPIV